MKMQKNKTRLILLTLLAISAFAQAQDYPPPSYGYRQPRGRREPPPPQVISPNPKGYVSISLGLANPMGAYGFSTGAGYGNYATQGSIYNLSVGVPLNGSNFGIAFMLGQCLNQFDINTFGTNFYNNPSNLSQILPSTAALSSPYLNSNNPVYNETHLMTGLFFTYPIQRFSFDLRALIGVMFINLPSVSVQYGADPYGSDATDEFDLVPNHSNTVAFAYDLGAGIRYLVPFFRGNTCIMLNADILQASTSYNVTETHTQWGPASATNYGAPTLVTQTSMSGSQPISLFTLSLGIGWQFEQR
jgi:hypothetical protein